MNAPRQLELQTGQPSVFRGAIHGALDPCVVIPLRWQLPESFAQQAALETLEATLRRTFRTWSQLSDVELVGGRPYRPERSGVLGFGNIAVQLATVLQAMAGHPVRTGFVKSDASCALLVLPYLEPSLAIEAARLAVQIAGRELFSRQGLRTAEKGMSTEAAIAAFGKRAVRFPLLPNARAFIKAARALDMPVDLLTGAILQVGWGSRSRRLDSSFTDRSSVVATTIARNKLLASNLLRKAGIPVPDQRVAASSEEARGAAEALGYPVVVKPLNQEQGTGVAAGLTTPEAVEKAYESASRFGKSVIVERHISGKDYRLLVLEGQMIAAGHRIPAGVTGDGTSTIAKLVDALNADPRRGTGKSALLIRVDLNEEARDLLTEQGFSPDSVPPAGQFVRLRRSANRSTGGTAEKPTQIHEDNVRLVERAARLIGLDIAGVDLIIPDLGASWREIGGAICEVNAQPGFGVHWLAEPERDLNGELLETLFRKGNGRIPIAAVTGTNGKTTVCQMLHHILSASGKRSGVSTTQGVWIARENVTQDHLAGYAGGRILLTDPSIDAAVIEMPRKGLIYDGFPFDKCSVAVLTNIQNDHIGVDGISTMEEMASLKATVLDRARDAVVLNADDPNCAALRDRFPGVEVIFFAYGRDSAIVRQHIEGGGRAVILSDSSGRNRLSLHHGTTEQAIIAVEHIPATVNGTLKVNVENALAAAAAASALGVSPADIALALRSFANDFNLNPGRFSELSGFPFRLIIDFAHNPTGMIELCRFVAGLPCSGKRRLATYRFGGRHRWFAKDVAVLSALVRTFDHVTVGLHRERVVASDDYQGIAYEEACEEFGRELKAAGLPVDAVDVEPEALAGITRALASARDGDIVVIVHDPHRARALIESFRLARRQLGPGEKAVSSQISCGGGR